MARKQMLQEEKIGIINEEEVEQVSQERQARRLQVEVKLDITSRRSRSK